MKRTLRKIYREKSNIYKVLLLLVTLGIILYLFPKGSSFKYDFQKGKPWMYDNLYAPFDFPVYKTDTELKIERQNIIDNTVPYYDYNKSVINQIKSKYINEFGNYFGTLKIKDYNQLHDEGLKFIDSIYRLGVILSNKQIGTTKLNLIKSKNKVELVNFDDLFKISSLKSSIESNFSKTYANTLNEFLFNILIPNVSPNKSITKRSVDEHLKKASLTRGRIDKGKRIVVKGEVVEGETYRILDSLKKEFKSQTWNEDHYGWVITGYAIFILLALIFLQLYIRKYYYAVYKDNNKVTFIFTNIILIVAITRFLVNLDALYVYAVPICILPLVIGVFLDQKVAFIIFITTLLLLGFIVPNSFEFLFMQSSVGLVVLISSNEVYKRTNLFITVGKITLVYIITYLSFNIIQEGTILKNLKIENLSLFLANALAILFVQPLTYIYEKVFVMVSDISLLELTDTNTSLLKELSEKAPGTFNHSLQVANLAEVAANELGAKTLLVRVGALYHDIGKLYQPAYFTENQVYIANLHDDITPKESAKIIINHVIKGIELGKKHNLPERVIDFIRTHHGTSLVHYFYHKEKEKNPNLDVSEFRYPGPIPFSKETVILMMSDAVEASSRSLKQPTQERIDKLVDKVISNQINENQFLNSNITLKDIEKVKKLFKKKLANIYKLRIEYPE